MTLSPPPAQTRRPHPRSGGTLPRRARRHFALPFALATVLALAGHLPGLGAADASASSPTASLFGDPLLARGKGFEIHQSEVDDMVTGLRATLAATRGQTLPDGQRREVAGQMLERLILLRMVTQRSTAEDRQKAKETADRFVADTKAKAKSEDSYRRQLIATGIKPEVFERRAFEQAVVETVVSREIKSKLTVTDDQIKAFYDQGVDRQVHDLLEVLARLEKDEGGTNTTFYADGLKRLSDVKVANLERLTQPDRVRARVILIHTIDRITREELPDADKEAKRQRAEQVLARLRAGEDFALLAKEFSEDLEVQRTGGEYTASREGVAFPELRAVLFSLPEGEVSDLVTTRVGFYIVKVLERHAAGKPPLPKIENDIRDHLLNQEVQKRLPAFLEELKKEYQVEIVAQPS